MEKENCKICPISKQGAPLVETHNFQFVRVRKLETPHGQNRASRMNSREYPVGNCP